MIRIRLAAPVRFATPVCNGMLLLLQRDGLHGTFARDTCHSSSRAGRYRGREGAPVCNGFSLRSLPAWLDAIPKRFSSSSLPPSFALGRFAAFSFFLPAAWGGAGALRRPGAAR